MKTLFWIPLFVIISWGTTTPISWGAASWATGPALQKNLAESVDIIWAEIPCQALESMARNENVAVLLDRRIDPGRKIEISLRQTPLKEALEAIAQKYNLGISMVGPVVYFAPPETARTVRTLVALRREDVRRLAPGAAKVLRAEVNDLGRSDNTASYWKNWAAKMASRSPVWNKFPTTCGPPPICRRSN